MVISQPYNMKPLRFQDPCLELSVRKVNFTYIKEFLFKLSFLGQQREGEGNQSQGYQNHVCVGWYHCGSASGVSTDCHQPLPHEIKHSAADWTPAGASQSKHQERIKVFGSEFSKTTLFLPMSCDLGNKITFTTQLRHLKDGSVI